MLIFNPTPKDDGKSVDALLFLDPSNQTGKWALSHYLSARYIEPNLFLDERSKKEKANNFVQLLAFFNALILLYKDKNYCLYIVAVKLFTYCISIIYVLKILKNGSTVFFTHLKIILLQCF